MENAHIKRASAVLTTIGSVMITLIPGRTLNAVCAAKISHGNRGALRSAIIK